ncbi:hypothetical protein SVIOM74S_03936 [Streptomyces violarus]
MTVEPVPAMSCMASEMTFWKASGSPGALSRSKKKAWCSSSTAAAGGLARLRSGGNVTGQDHDENEKAPTRGMDPPHRFLPVHRRRAPSPGTEAMYTC